VIQEKVQHFFN